MALDLITVPPLPTVPDAPGVPSIARVSLGASVGRLNGALTAAQAAVTGMGGAVPQADTLMAQVAAHALDFNAAAGGFTGGAIGRASPLATSYDALRGSTDSLGNLAGSLGGAFPDFTSAAGGLSSAVSVTGSALTTVGFEQKVLTADSGSATALEGSTSKPHWGLFSADAATAVLVGDAVLEVDLETESRTPDYPIEGGGFQTYNKVQLPTEGRLTLAKAGSIAERQLFLVQLNAIRTGLTLYAVVMPEGYQPNVNVLGVRYNRRAEAGAQLIVAELHVKEVRAGATVAFSNTKDPVSEGQKSNGPSQAQSATPTQSAATGVII